ncbi:hypothetical protein X474_27030 [Dethiosulfatarculus sandiegensis]|uniref:SPOR domain-containing protein n=2 Tax=Dethiosulfatarculus sandiegensis TaxID=1429043 RepID=A0A0D2J5Q5_9BACT|nr:hypothetical protein X474_27030 [Dethiosulfatarculus sandiegensis]
MQTAQSCNALPFFNKQLVVDPSCKLFFTPPALNHCHDPCFAPIIPAMEAKQILKNTLALILLLSLALLTAGCAAKKEQTPPLESKVERPALDRGPRYCLWLLVVKDNKDLAEVKNKLAQKTPFALVVREMLAKSSRNNLSSLDCMAARDLEPWLLKIAQGLGIGEVSSPFTWDQGTAFIMRTTDIYRRQGRMLYDQGKYLAAEAMFTKDLALHPDSAPMWQIMGMSKAARGDQEGALKALEKAVRYAPRDAGILQDLATTLVYLGEPEKAVPIFERALDISPQNVLITSNLAWALALANQNLDRAEDLAMRAVERNPNRARFWSTLGLVQQKQGDHGAALLSLHQAARLNPADSTNQQRILNSLMALGPDSLKGLTHDEKPSLSKTLAQKPRAKVKASPVKPEKKTKASVPKPEKPVTQKVKKPSKDKKPTSAKGKRDYFLQVSSFRRLDLAQRDVRKWRRLKVGAWLDTFTAKDGSTWITVVLGPYPSLDKARKMGRRFKKDHRTKSFRIFSRPRGWRPHSPA